MSHHKPAFARFAVLASCMFFAASLAPAQFAGSPMGTPPSFVTGPTLGDTLRNAVQATSDQARLTAQTAAEMGRRARNSTYSTQNFSTDYQNLQLHFANLRSVFGQVAALVVQLQSARAANAAAELDAGLNIIAEGFVPMQQEYQAGTFSRDTIVRCCQILNEAILEWQKELKKDSRRLGTIR